MEPTRNDMTAGPRLKVGENGSEAVVFEKLSMWSRFFWLVLLRIVRVDIGRLMGALRRVYRLRLIRPERRLRGRDADLYERL